MKNSNKYQQRAVKSEKIPINSNQERKNSEKIELKFCTNATFQKKWRAWVKCGWIRAKNQKKEKNHD